MTGAYVASVVQRDKKCSALKYYVGSCHAKNCSTSLVQNISCLYVQSKLEMLKDHAEHMLDKVLTNPNVTAEKLVQMPESERKMLKERVDTADKVRCCCLQLLFLSVLA